ncbi:Ig-like domain-containing protein [Dermabacteraceae bacterium P13115]
MKLSGVLRAFAALLLVCGLILPSGLAYGLGEEDGFKVPMRTNSVQAVPRHAAQFRLDLMIDPVALGSLETASLRLVPAPDTPADVRARMNFSDDSQRLVVPGEGTWQVFPGRVDFSPLGNFNGNPTPIAVRVMSLAHKWSAPVPLQAQYPEVKDIFRRVSQGSEVTVNLAQNTINVRPETVRFVIDNLPVGSSVTSNGRSVVIPDEGTWTLPEKSTEARFVPQVNFRQHQPTPVYYTAFDSAGVAAVPAAVYITTPRLPPMTRSAPYGKPVEFPVLAQSENIDAELLRLHSVAGDEKAADALTVPSEGEWRLDSKRGIVTFTPRDAAVRNVTPIEVSGFDRERHAAKPVLLQVGYPELADQYRAETFGKPIKFTPLRNSRNIDAKTLRIEGANPLKVPGEGEWRYDEKTHELTFTPEANFKDSPAPIRMRAEGTYNQNPTSSQVRAVYAESVPLLRDETVRIPPGSTVYLNPLGNDKPASAYLPFRVSSLRLSVPSLVTQSGVVQPGSGRLTIPNQGSLSIDRAGIVTFVAEPEFEGEVSPIEYTVSDIDGIRATGSIQISVMPGAPQPSAVKPHRAAVELLQRLYLSPEGSPPERSLYVTICAFLLFAGSVCLWVGRRIHAIDSAGRVVEIDG